MKKSLILRVVCAVLFSLSTVSANAELHGRLPLTPGGTDYQAAYDDVLDITWVTNAALGEADTWDNQVAWANSLNYIGFNDWRLASMSVSAGLPTGTASSLVNCSTATELACRDNELGYMFYQNMGGSLFDNKTGDQSVDGVLLSNVQNIYWSGTDLRSDAAQSFVFGSGQTQGAAGKNDHVAGWAVRSGDVADVPLTAAGRPIEAESMALSGGYAVEANTAASGGQLIRRLDSGGYAATASTEYTGAAGNYDIAVSYFDENDGMSNLAFLLNGQMLDEWVADEDPVCSDCASPGANTLRTRVVVRGIRLLPGDEITLQGTGEHYEYARFDKLTVSPAGSSTYEAEKMALKGGYAVEANSAASGGQLIRRLDSGGYAATASTDFAGLAGTYEITVSYFDESDGVSSLAFLVNGEILDQWLAEEDPVCSDCDSPGASTLRTRVVASELGLQPGDEITLQGTGEHYEYARFDKLTVAPTVVGPVIFDDGGVHTIDYTVDVEIIVSFSDNNGTTTLNIVDGANVQRVTAGGGTNVNISGGTVDGLGYCEATTFHVSGGEVGRIVADCFGWGVDGTISGGNVGDLMFWSNHLLISGGSVDRLLLGAGLIEIAGGSVESIEFFDDFGAGVDIEISGGKIPNELSYLDGLPVLTFFGSDLALTGLEPVPGENESILTGTLRDGTPVDTRIICIWDFGFPPGNPPCSGVLLVNEP
jgi:hypothetical protein